MQAYHPARSGSGGPPPLPSVLDPHLRRSPRGHYKPEHNDFVFLCLNAAIEGLKVIECQLKRHESDLAELAETLTLARSSLVGFVTAPVHDPYFDLTIEGLKQTLLAITNRLHEAGDAGGALTTAVLIDLYREDFLLKQRLDQFQALWKDKMEAAGIEDIQGRLWWTSHCGPLSFLPWSTFVSQMRQSQSDFPADEESTHSICEYLDFTRDGFISIYEFHIFLSWFGPLHGCWQRLLDPLKEGIMMGFMPAIEANHLLNKRRPATFIDTSSHTKHCLLHHVSPVGMTLKNPPDVYRNLREFVGAHSAKLKLPLGKEPDTQPLAPQPQREVLKPDITSTALQALASSSPSSPSSLKGSNSGPEDDHMGPNDATQQCVICMDKPVGAVFLECGHLACCVTCASPLRLCPICRGTITRIVQIFRP